jgi:hypothetical protein
MGNGRRLPAYGLSVFLALQPVAWSQQPQSIRILVVAGQDAVNDVDKRVVSEPVVQVQDGSGTPLAGAEVVFRTPSTGPTATFYGATRTTAVTTDDKGQARAAGMTPNTDVGMFEIAVTATHGSAQAETFITQTNTFSAVEKKKGGLGWRLWTAIGAGAVIGIIAAARR